MTYKRRNRDFEQRLARRRDEIRLSELELLHACILILEPQEPEITGSESRFIGDEHEYNADEQESL
jgi:hypothetical protein